MASEQIAIEQVDVAVIGAGPAGMSAAIAAREAGRSVVLLDEQPALGGQIFRGIESVPAKRRDVLGRDYAAGKSVFESFKASGARHEPGAAVWQITRERGVHFVQAGVSRTLQADRVILCTGAMERPVPVPGWTLPGVMTAGAGQILLKSGGVVPSGSVVLAGCGPLLYLLAAQYQRAGVNIRALVDTTTWQDPIHALRELPAALRDWRVLGKGAQLLLELRRSGVPVFKGARDLAISGDSEATHIRFRVGSRTHQIEAGLFLLHLGVVPNTHPTFSLRAAHDWDDSQLCWIPRTSDTGELEGIEGIYVAGDGAGIIGAQASCVSGRIAGLAAAAAQGSRPTEEMARLMAALRRTRAARKFLERIYRPPADLRIPSDEVIVCRCEEVRAGELREHVRRGCPGPNQLKSFTRCGMGPCQGRQCSLTTTELMAAERKVPVEEVGYLRIRPPLKPISIGELAG